MSTSPRVLKRWKKLVDEGIYVVCALCNKRMEKSSEVTVDHIHPRSKGGKNRWQNLQPAHSACNSKRGNVSIETYHALRNYTLKEDTTDVKKER